MPQRLLESTRFWNIKRQAGARRMVTIAALIAARRSPARCRAAARSISVGAARQRGGAPALSRRALVAFVLNDWRRQQRRDVDKYLEASRS